MANNTATALQWYDRQTDTEGNTTMEDWSTFSIKYWQADTAFYCH